MLFIQTDVKINQRDLLNSYNTESLYHSFSIDVHIVTMTTVTDIQGIGVVLHRNDLDTCFYQEYEHYPLSNGLVKSFFLSTHSLFLFF